MHFLRSKFHFVGIGGIGMCGIAELLVRRGAQVSGSDLAENANTERLRALGVQIFHGHQEKNIGDADVVVFSSAIKADNPEIEAARNRKIPLIPRAEALAELMRTKRGVAIAGTHGKTTTTAMAGAVFMAAHAQPTIVIGGRMESLQSTAHLGEGEWFIAEADESDGSFQKLWPEISIITNIDNDHLDYFRTFDRLLEAFVEFGMKVPFYGALIICGDDQSCRKVFRDFSKRVWSYGFDPANDFVITGAKGEYELNWLRAPLGKFSVSVPGRHNALNATAAILAGMKAGFSFELCKEGIRSFRGVDRRFQLKGERNGILIFDDYGHHPTEVRATLEAFREKFPDRRIVVLFQPHRYSRTRTCWSDFLTCFTLADRLMVTDIYSAGERPIQGVFAEKLVAEIRHPNKSYLPKGPQLAEAVMAELKTGDVFLTLGAGDGWKTGQAMLEILPATI